jgi:hypothetical protein
MVTTNWREMEAGRELDRLIAEKVGWRFEREPYFNPESTLVYSPEGVEMYHQSGIWTPVFAGEEVHKVIPHYSTDLNAAITLANGIVEFNLFKGRKVDTEGSPTDGWICTISDPKNFDSAWADTPALAICRAFLASKEAQL